MSRKTIIFLCMFVGSMVGGYVPAIWGDTFFSYTSIFLSGAGGLIGVYAGYKLGDYLGI